MQVSNWIRTSRVRKIEPRLGLVFSRILSIDLRYSSNTHISIIDAINIPLGAFLRDDLPRAANDNRTRRNICNNDTIRPHRNGIPNLNTTQNLCSWADEDIVTNDRAAHPLATVQLTNRYAMRNVAIPAN